jgi:hypothetical protein
VKNRGRISQGRRDRRAVPAQMMCKRMLCNLGM